MAEELSDRVVVGGAQFASAGLASALLEETVDDSGRQFGERGFHGLHFAQQKERAHQSVRLSQGFTPLLHFAEEQPVQRIYLPQILARGARVQVAAHLHTRVFRPRAHVVHDGGRDCADVEVSAFGQNYTHLAVVLVFDSLQESGERRDLFGGREFGRIEGHEFGLSSVYQIRYVRFQDGVAEGLAAGAQIQVPAEEGIGSRVGRRETHLRASTRWAKKRSSCGSTTWFSALVSRFVSRESAMALAHS